MSSSKARALAGLARLCQPTAYQQSINPGASSAPGLTSLLHTYIQTTDINQIGQNRPSAFKSHGLIIAPSLVSDSIAQRPYTRLLTTTSVSKTSNDDIEADDEHQASLAQLDVVGPELEAGAKYLGKTLGQARSKTLPALQNILGKLGRSESSTSSDYLSAAATVVSSQREFQLVTQLTALNNFLSNIQGAKILQVLTNAPSTLYAAVHSIERMEKNAAWLETTLGLTGLELGKIVNKNGHLLIQNLETTIKPALDLLYGLGFTTDDVRSIVVRHPRVLVYTRGKLNEMLAALKDPKLAGLSEAEVKFLVWRQPTILGNTRMRLQATINWMRERGLDNGQVSASLLRFPAILTYSIETNLEAKLYFLRYEVHLTPDAIKKVLVHSPDVLGRSIDRLKAFLDGARAAGLSDDQIRTCAEKYPGILRFNLTSPNYARKLDYLKEELDREVGATLATHPMYLTYGMDRIALRGAYMKYLLRNTASLTAWLSASEEEFLIKCAISDSADFDMFKERWLQSEESKRWLQHQ